MSVPEARAEGQRYARNRSPDLDWVALATGMGVPAGRAVDCESLRKQLQRGLTEPGPYLIEVVL